MGWMWVWPVLVVIGLIVLGYVGVLLARGQVASLPGGSSSARQILDERFARGEIDEEDYRRWRAELQ